MGEAGGESCEAEASDDEGGGESEDSAVLRGGREEEVVRSDAVAVSGAPSAHWVVLRALRCAAVRRRTGRGGRTASLQSLRSMRRRRLVMLRRALTKLA